MYVNIAISTTITRQYTKFKQHQLLNHDICYNYWPAPPSSVRLLHNHSERPFPPQKQRRLSYLCLSSLSLITVSFVLCLSSLALLSLSLIPISHHLKRFSGEPANWTASALQYCLHQTKVLLVPRNATLFFNGLPVSDVKKKFIKFLVGVTNLPGSGSGSGFRFLAGSGSGSGYGFNESGSETLLFRLP